MLTFKKHKKHNISETDPLKDLFFCVQTFKKKPCFSTGLSQYKYRSKVNGTLSIAQDHNNLYEIIK